MTQTVSETVRLMHQETACIALAQAANILTDKSVVKVLQELHSNHELWAQPTAVSRLSLPVAGPRKDAG